MSDGFGYLKKKLYLCHMKQKKQTYQLLHLKELPLSKMVELYHDYASSHGLHKHQERKIYEGIEMLIHFIAKQQITNSEEKENEYKLGLAEINYDIADKVIGDVFQDVITFLRETDIIRIAKGYEVGKKSFAYIVNPSYTIEKWYTELAYPAKFYERLTRAVNQQYERILASLPEPEKEFRKAYDKNLNKVKVTNIEALERYVKDYDYRYLEDIIDKKHGGIIHSKGEINEYKKISYGYSLEAYLKKKHQVYNWDEYGRIHHFITNSPKGYRDYLNIWFHIDVHNCQPLLFASLIYEYYGISRKVIEYISESYNDFINGVSDYHERIVCEYHNKAFNYHYETRNDCNVLNSSELDEIKKNIATIPIDVLEYIHLVMSGKLWDVLATTLGMKRDDVKGIMFGELFYSNAKGIMPWQTHAKVFQEHFPNVSKAIVSIRNSHPKSWLPLEMQRRESKIMRKVLWRLMQRGYDVVSIHDAILMLDTDNNHSRTQVDYEFGETLDNVEREVERELQFAYWEEGMGCAVGW